MRSLLLNKILKAWRSLGRGGDNSNMRSLLLNKGSSKSFSENAKGQIVKITNGCFTVYVGLQSQRFVVKTKFVNHPKFKMLLDEAEVEYGFQNDGAIRIPCNVDMFYRVLAEMNNIEQDYNINNCTCRSFKKAMGFSFFCSSKPHS